MSASLADPNPPEAYVSPKQYAQLTGFSIATVRRYLDEGKLPKHQPGGPRSRIVIPLSALRLTEGKQVAPGDATDCEEPRDAEASAPDEAPTRRYGPRPRWQTQRNKKR